ncbi:MAG TPA: hypothetical protein VH854_09495 [Thermoanaerobaculia bacterium]|jgi:hypothetical protein|nr:hypothetical protein [Thermoanaerobaculia bacterium]
MTDFDHRGDERDGGRALARCANAPCPRSVDPGDAYCGSCGLERSLFTRRGGERDSGAHERPGR